MTGSEVALTPTNVAPLWFRAIRLMVAGVARFNNDPRVECGTQFAKVYPVSE